MEQLQKMNKPVLRRHAGRDQIGNQYGEWSAADIRTEYEKKEFDRHRARYEVAANKRARENSGAVLEGAQKYGIPSGGKAEQIAAGKARLVPHPMYPIRAEYEWHPAYGTGQRFNPMGCDKNTFYASKFGRIVEANPLDTPRNATIQAMLEARQPRQAISEQDLATRFMLRDRAVDEHLEQTSTDAQAENIRQESLQRGKWRDDVQTKRAESHADSTSDPYAHIHIPPPPPQPFLNLQNPMNAPVAGAGGGGGATAGLNTPAGVDYTRYRNTPDGTMTAMFNYDGGGFAGDTPPIYQPSPGAAVTPVSDAAAAPASGAAAAPPSDATTRVSAMADSSLYRLVQNSVTVQKFIERHGSDGDMSGNNQKIMKLYQYATSNPIGNVDELREALVFANEKQTELNSLAERMSRMESEKDLDFEVQMNYDELKHQYQDTTLLLYGNQYAIERGVKVDPQIAFGLTQEHAQQLLGIQTPDKIQQAQPPTSGFRAADDKAYYAKANKDKVKKGNGVGKTLLRDFDVAEKGTIRGYNAVKNEAAKELFADPTGSNLRTSRTSLRKGTNKPGKGVR